MKITSLTFQSSKAEEIEALTDLVKKIQLVPGTYVASLFTGRLVEWFKERASMDFTCDIMDELNGALEDVRKAEHANIQANNEIESLNNQIKRQAAAADAAVASEKQETANVQRMLDYARKENERIMECGRVTANQYYNLKNQLENTQAVVRDQAEQILQLKAKMFDLMTAKEEQNVIMTPAK